jgi:type I restriction-modification system DNA methylase subunit
MTDTQKELIKKLEWFAYKKRIQEVFCDLVEYEALKVALTFDYHNHDSRAKRQQEIIGYYKDDLEHFHSALHLLHQILVNTIEYNNDALGEIYMEIGAANKHNQQFFTPMSISRLMASVNFRDLDVSKDVITIGEPCCGSGCILLGALKELEAKKINYAEKVLIVANDIDKNCVNMCFLQLAFAGAVAIIQHQNTITQEVIGETFITPAFVLQYGKFMKVYKKLKEK